MVNFPIPTIGNCCSITSLDSHHLWRTSRYFKCSLIWRRVWHHVPGFSSSQPLSEWIRTVLPPGKTNPTMSGTQAELFLSPRSFQMYPGSRTDSQKNGLKTFFYSSHSSRVLHQVCVLQPGLVHLGEIFSHHHCTNYHAGRSFSSQGFSVWLFLLRPEQEATNGAPGIATNGAIGRDVRGYLKTVDRTR